MVRIDDIRYTPQLSAQAVDHALAVKGSRITVEIDFTVRVYLTAGSSAPIGFGVPQVAPTPHGYIKSSANLPIFQDFNEGDQITITGTGTSNTTATIIEKVSDLLIRTDASFPTPENSTSAVIYMSTDIKSIRYYFGLIENNDGYIHWSEK